MCHKVTFVLILTTAILCIYFSTANAKVQHLDEITVTAQKNEEKPQDIPISLDYFSDVQLEDAKIENLFDLMAFSTNAHMLERSCEHIVVIRGISPFRGCTYAPAGLYVDDVSYPLHYMQNFEFFDLQRAEILKGPQGTLYGRNVESGVINLHTRQPGRQFSGKVSAEYGSYNTSRALGEVSLPLVEDKLFLGVTGLYKTSDGYVKNISNGNKEAADEKHAAGRATLRWTPTPRWDVSFTADVMNSDDHGAESRFLYGPKATDPHEVRRDTEAYLKQDWNSQTMRLKYDGDGFNVVSVTNTLYQTLDKVNDCDLWDDPANQSINPTTIKERQYTQEVRVSSDADRSLQWLLGFYGFIERSKFDYQYNLLSSGMTYMHPVTDVDSSGYAVFGQATYTMLDRLHLTLGLRYDHQSLDGDLRDEVKNVGYSKELSFDELLPKTALSLDITENIMAYASAAKGYLVGGYNWGLTGTSEIFCFDPEYTWNYEAGLKSKWWGNKLAVNLSAFYINIDDKQVSELHPTIAATTITNAAEATSKGFELQVRANPLVGLEVFGGFGYTEAKFDKFEATVWDDSGTSLTEKDYSGNHLQYAPEYTYNFGVQYRAESGFFARADFIGTGPFYGDAANEAKQEAYMIVNFQAGWETEFFDFRLWVMNAFDENYLTFLSPFQQSIVGIDGPARTVGADITVRF